MRRKQRAIPGPATREAAMGTPEQGTVGLTPEESWRSIHETLDRSRSSMYVAGMSTILLLWGAIVSLGYFWQYAAQTFASDCPGGPAPGFPCHSGWHSVSEGWRAAPSSDAAQRRGWPLGSTGRSAGIRVFLFWMAVMTTAFLVPGAAGMWNGELAARIPYVVVGIVGARIRPVRHNVPSGLGGGGFGDRSLLLPSELPRRRCCASRVGGRDAASSRARLGVDSARTTWRDRRGHRPQRDHPPVDQAADNVNAGPAARHGSARPTASSRRRCNSRAGT